MTTRLRIWWKGLSLREQRLLVAMGVLLAVTLVWLGVISPMADALGSARGRLADAQVTLAQVERDADRLRTLRKAVPPRLNGSLILAIGSAADGLGLTPTSVLPDGPDGARVEIAAIRSPALFALVQALRKQGAVATQVSARQGEAGVLSATILFRKARAR